VNEKPQSILMVDDELPNLNLFRRLFKKQYEVLTAETGAKALRLLEAEPVDLVICDQRMPGMSGIELLEIIRKKYPKTSRIMVTAYPDLRVAVDAINLGQVSRYILKPWDNAELAALVKQELRLRQYREENEKLAFDLQRRNLELERANLELTSIDRIKSEFLSNITHELRTPLISAIGYIDLLLSARDGELNASQKKYLAKALKNTERLKDLVADLVDFSSRERGLETSAFSVVNLVKLAGAQADLIEIQARQKGISIERDFPPEAVTVRADMTQMGQVLANLLGNAIKFSGRGGRIEVRLLPQDETVRVEVADTGIGIPPEHLDRVFERFFQVDSSITRRHGGTGIGLSLVKNILEFHRAKFGVNSEAGKGSTFWFELPRSDARAAPHPAPEPEADRSA
jgi:signal transduction histidine kinase